MIKKASELVTSHRAICDGFLAQALTKIEKALPYIQTAQNLLNELRQVSDLTTLVSSSEVREELLFAAGFSDKARSHLTEKELSAALDQAVKTIADYAKNDWREEVVYRYLLTKGDSLGGSLRNITGALAGERFASSIIGALVSRGFSPEISKSNAKNQKIQIIAWPERIMLFDKKPEFIGNNIDVILLKISKGKSYKRLLLEDPNSYIACGELKGGIDPAGADEHWKTANSALQRIYSSFSREDRPSLFFIGAAIETAMANEIFAQIQNGKLNNAANFTVPEQVRALAYWLVGL